MPRRGGRYEQIAGDAIQRRILYIEPVPWFYGRGVTKRFLGKLNHWGIRPGQLLFSSNPDLVWDLIASMYVGNALLLLMNIFLIPLFVAMLRIPYSIIMGFIVIFASIGAYSVNNNMFDVSMMVGFGLLVYAMRSCTIPSSRSSWQWSSGGSPKTPSVRRSRSPPGD